MMKLFRIYNIIYFFICKNRNWKVFYEGKLNYCRATNLKPCRSYLIRVKSYNGYYSDPIEVNTNYYKYINKQINTNNSDPCYSDIWNTGFPIECCQTNYSDLEIEIGDVILFADEIPNENERIERLVYYIYIIIDNWKSN